MINPIEYRKESLSGCYSRLLDRSSTHSPFINKNHIKNKNPIKNTIKTTTKNRNTSSKPRISYKWNISDFSNWTGKSLSSFRFVMKASSLLITFVQMSIIGFMPFIPCISWPSFLRKFECLEKNTFFWNFSKKKNFQRK